MIIQPRTSYLSLHWASGMSLCCLCKDWNLEIAFLILVLAAVAVLFYLTQKTFIQVYCVPKVFGYAIMFLYCLNHKHRLHFQMDLLLNYERICRIIYTTIIYNHVILRRVIWMMLFVVALFIKCIRVTCFAKSAYLKMFATLTLLCLA